MAGYVGKTTNQDREVVAVQAQSEREDMYGPMPGVVTAYDPSTQTATIKPLFKKKKYDGSDLEMPELLEVPIDFPRGGNSAITQPVPVGTRVQLTPQMRSMENYDTKDEGTFSDTRSMNLSDMRASLSGGDSLSSPLKNVDPDNMHIRFDEEGKFGIRGSPEGKIKIEGSDGNIYEIIAEFMELVASDQLQINYGSSAGSGHQLQNRAALMELAAKVRSMAL